MEIIIHRINKIKELKKIPTTFGTEVDIRAYRSKLILNHEPKQTGEDLDDYLENYKNGTLILNIKESGIEDEVIKKVKSYKQIKNFFLLDVEIPYLFNSMKLNKNYCAIRTSYYEPIKSILKYKKIFNWLWIDTIKNISFDDNREKKILKNFKKCLVCPERWGMPQKIKFYKSYFRKNKINLDAIMTSMKYSKVWLEK